MSNLPAQTLPIALDAMGGDHGLEVTIPGAIEAAREDGLRVLLVGNEEQMTTAIRAAGGQSFVNDGRLILQHAPDVVEMDEKPAAAVRKKKQSSMRVACDLVRDGQACGAVSAGNSGAMMAIALVVYGRIKGVARPCLAARFPSMNAVGYSILVDAGANTDCTPEHLLQFGLMGDAYARAALGIENPAICVASNGGEEGKGTDLTRAAYALLSEADLNFVGYIEGNEATTDKASVIVADGFTGNMMLKTAEGAFKFLVDSIKHAYDVGGPLVKLGGLLSKPAFQYLRDRADHRKLSGVPLLGLAHPGFIAHGRSDTYEIRRALGNGATFSTSGMIERIREALEHYAEAHPKQPSGAAGTSSPDEGRAA